MLQIQTLTSDNISALVEAIRERLVGQYYSVTLKTQDNLVTRSGHYIDKPHQVRETSLKIIIIEDNLDINFISSDDQVTLHQDGFEFTSKHKGQTNHWIFKLDRTLS